MAPRKLRKKVNSINTSTGTRQSKRLLDQNETILDSPKKLCYNPSSSSLEKRDLQYCKAIEKQSVPTLKSLRVDSVDEDDEDEFCGFIQKDVQDNGDWVKRTVANLEIAQELMDEYIAAEPADADACSYCLPEPAPLDEAWMIQVI